MLSYKVPLLDSINIIIDYFNRLKEKPDIKVKVIDQSEISEEEFKILADKFPDIDFSKIYRYEEEDYTTAAQELACLAGNCDAI